MPPMKPNILLILIDDMGWRDLTCYGSSFYETPHLDRLAARGMRFTDAYAACPVCSPTRASILTGKYPARLGTTQWFGGSDCGKLLSAPYVDHLPLEETSLATALRDGGYQTWHVGKWHLGGEAYYPQHHGFDANIGGCHWGSPKRGYFSPYGLPTLTDGPEGEYLTDRLTDEAIGLVSSAGDRPFFLNYWAYAVHNPIQVPQALIEKYRRKAADLGLDQRDPMEPGEPFPCEHKKDKRVERRRFQSNPAYAAMVENLDSNLGRLLGALEAAGKADDTLVIFTSDNGGLSTAEGSPTCNAPLCEGKGWMYEGGTREPLIVSWPGVIEPGATCETPVTSTDFYPTVLEAAGLAPLPDQHRDGESLMPLLRGGDQLDRRAIYWHYPHYGNQGGTPGSSIRAGDEKLIEFFETGGVELYNLRDDIAESHNLAPDHPARAAELKALLADWRTSVEARLPTPNPDYAEPASR